MKVTGHARNTTVETATARRGEPGWRNAPTPGAKARRKAQRKEARAAAERYARRETPAEQRAYAALAQEVARRMARDASPLLGSQDVTPRRSADLACITCGEEPMARETATARAQDADRQLSAMAAKALLDRGA